MSWLNLFYIPYFILFYHTTILPHYRMLSYYYIYERSNILTQKGCSYPEEESPKEEEEEDSFMSNPWFHFSEWFQGPEAGLKDPADNKPVCVGA